MAYDAVRQRVVLYGGERTQLDDTWEWDGAAWSLRAPSGPGVRYPVMTYDQVRGRVVMVGEGRAFDWDGAAWYELDAAGLPNLEIPGIAFDAARSRVTVFSGDSYSGQTFQLSPALAPPSIARQPENTIAASGDSVVIDIEAAGGKPLSYQWRKDRVPLANAGPISGANTLALTINPVAPEHFGVYDCVVTNQCGEAISNPVALSVLPPPNPCPADFNNSGAVDSQDFFDFLTAFFTGCP